MSNSACGRLLLGRDVHVVVNEQRSSSPSSLWNSLAVGDGTRGACSKSYGLSPASANESFWSGNIPSAQLPSDLRACMVSSETQESQTLLPASPPKTGSSNAPGSTYGPFLVKQYKWWKWRNLLCKFFLLKNTQRCRGADQLEGIHRTPEEPPGQAWLWLSWGRGIPDTFTRASFLHQQQKGGWGPAPKQLETPGDQCDLF